jgi:hypothetical protein
MSQPVKSRKASTAHSIVTVMLILALGGGLLQIGATLYRAVASPEELSVAAGFQTDRLRSLELPDGVHVPGSIPISLEIEDPSPVQVALAAAINLGAWALAIAALLLLRALAGSIRDGDPFGHRNVSRLRKLGAVLVAVPFVTILNSFLLGGILAMSRVPEAVGTSLSLNGTPFIAAVGIFVLAEVFQEGVRLREDAEGTI